MEVLPLTPDRFDALASLFNEGGDPRWCWCLYWRVRGRDWEQGSPSRNRDRLRALGESVPAPGLVALRDGVAIGWVGLGPRTDFERLERSRVIPKIDDRPVWSIVCFVVSKGARGEGIARALLNAAVDYARANGAPAVEAYPTDTGGERLTAAAAYTGTLAMFESAGFEIASPTSSVSGGRPRVIVRRRLGPRVDGPPASHGWSTYPGDSEVDRARPRLVCSAGDQGGRRGRRPRPRDGGAETVHLALILTGRRTPPAGVGDSGRSMPISR